MLFRSGSGGPGLMKNTGPALNGYNAGGNVAPGSRPNTANTGEALGGYSSGSMNLPYNWSSIISRARAGYPKDVDYDALYNRSNG